MFRPIAMFLFLVLVIADSATPTHSPSSIAGILVWLCIIPAIAIISAAVASKAKTIPLFATLLILLSWCIAMFWISWMQFVRDNFGNLILLDEIVVLLPVVVALSILWFVIAPNGNRRIWMTQRIRIDLMMFLCPVLVLWGIRESVHYSNLEQYGSLIEWSCILLLLVGSPIWIPRILPAFNMKNAVLSTAIQEVGRRAGVRISKVLVWNSHFKVMNALAVGFVPRWRVIILSDLLIARLTPKELLAIAGHEVGHHRFWHLPLYGLTFLCALLWISHATSFLFPSANVLVLLLCAIPLLIFCMMLVSRQCERQADAHAVVDATILEGAEVVSEESVAPMIYALDAIAHVHQIQKSRDELFHGSITSRQKHVAELVGISIYDLPINRRVRNIKCGVITLVFIGLLL